MRFCYILANVRKVMEMMYDLWSSLYPFIYYKDLNLSLKSFFESLRNSDVMSVWSWFHFWKQTTTKLLINFADITHQISLIFKSISYVHISRHDFTFNSQISYSIDCDFECSIYCMIHIEYKQTDIWEVVQQMNEYYNKNFKNWTLN